MPESLRVFAICSIKPLAVTLIGALCDLGHVPVALLAPRRDDGRERPPHLLLTDASAPPGLDLLLAGDRHAIEPLIRAYEPDLMICWGLPWKIPEAALDVPRLGSVNMHPALLPRHRGPIPLAWALRDGDSVWGATWHRLVAFDPVDPQPGAGLAPHLWLVRPASAGGRARRRAGRRPPDTPHRPGWRRAPGGVRRRSDPGRRERAAVRGFSLSPGFRPGPTRAPTRRASRTAPRAAPPRRR